MLFEICSVTVMALNLQYFSVKAQILKRNDISSFFLQTERTDVCLPVEVNACFCCAASDSILKLCKIVAGTFHQRWTIDKIADSFVHTSINPL